MNYKLEQIQTPELPELDSTTVYDEIRTINEELNKFREDKILMILKEKGFEFNSRAELLHFAKTRCELVSFSYNGHKILRVDGKNVCEFWETSKFNWEINNCKADTKFHIIKL